VKKWPSSQAPKVYRALLKIGWSPKPGQRGGSSHLQLIRQGWNDFTWAFHDDVEIGPKMLAKIAKHTGLEPTDL